MSRIMARDGNKPCSNQGETDSGGVLVKKELMACVWFWSEQQTPMLHVAPFSSMVLILGGDEELSERARATWGGVFVPRRNLNAEPV